MVKMLRVKTLIPALLRGGRRRCFSDIPSNFPFAAAAAAADGGGRGTSRRLSARTNNSVISSPEQMHDRRSWRNLHPSVASSKQSFPSNKVGVAENLKHLLTTPTVDDDDFEELGPSLQYSAELSSDRMKEKYKDTNPSALSLDNEGTQARIIHMQQSARRKSHLRFLDEMKPSHRTDVSITRTENQDYAVENKQSIRTISIDKVPPGMNLQTLKQAASFYGEILNASFETGPDRLSSCRVEFKSMESKERVLAAQRITVGNCQLPVRDLYLREYITIRIGNISTESTEPAVHSMCATCGTVAGLSRTKEGAIDVVFKVKGNFEAQTVLRRLNIVNYRGCRWSAQLVPLLQQNSMTDSSSTQWSVGSLINNEMETFRKQFQMQRIYLEDLENLHYGISHLRDQPVDFNSQVSAERDRRGIEEKKLSEFV